MENHAASTKLAISLYNLTPCKPGKPTACSVLNQGKASKGVCVLFFGDSERQGRAVR